MSTDLYLPLSVCWPTQHVQKRTPLFPSRVWLLLSSITWARSLGVLLMLSLTFHTGQQRMLSELYPKMPRLQPLLSTSLPPRQSVSSHLFCSSVIQGQSHNSRGTARLRERSGQWRACEGVSQVRSRKIKRNSHTVLMAGSEGGKASLQAKSWFVWMGTEDNRRLLFLKGILEFQI